jgi:hypothetical protein
MSKMAELYMDLETDFERLSHTSMQWDQDTWAEQAADGRFEGRVNFDHNFIFWFESYPAVVAAKSILMQMDEEFEVLYDKATDEWVMTTTLITMTWSM